MLIILLTSTLIAASCSNWPIIWVIIEINTLAMCFILSNKSNSENSNESSTFSYYITQVVGSMGILLYTLSSVELPWVLALCVTLNIGIWPTHSWYINLINTLSLNSIELLTLMTWQNVIPLLLVFSINNSTTELTTTLVGAALVSSVAPVWNLSNNISLNNVIALSSLNISSWLMVSTLCSLSVLVGLLMVYSASLVVAINAIKGNNKKNNIENISTQATILILGNIGGMPPFAVFWANVSVVLCLINNQIIIIGVAIILIIGVFSYNYMWIIVNESTSAPSKTQNPQETNNTETNIATINLIITVPAILWFFWATLG